VSCPAEPYQELDVAVVDGEGPGEVGPALQDEDLVADSSLGTAQGQVHLRDGRAAKPRDPPPASASCTSRSRTLLGMGGLCL